MWGHFIGLLLAAQCNAQNAEEPSCHSADSKMPQFVGKTVDKEDNEEPKVSEVEIDTTAGDEDFHCGMKLSPKNRN